jgi:hypothetical protein
MVAQHLAEVAGERFAQRKAAFSVRIESKVTLEGKTDAGLAHEEESATGEGGHGSH